MCVYVGVTGFSQQVCNPICLSATRKVTLITDLSCVSPHGNLSCLYFSLCSTLPFIPSVSLPVCFLLLLVLIVFSSQSFLPLLKFDLSLLTQFSSFRMVGDEDDEGALSDSDSHGGLTADDLASK